MHVGAGNGNRSRAKSAMKTALDVSTPSSLPPLQNNRLQQMCPTIHRANGPQISVAVDSDLDLRQYLADNYGHCALGTNCECLKSRREWLGTLCPHWQPLGAMNWEDLKRRQVSGEDRRIGSA